MKIKLKKKQQEIQDIIYGEKNLAKAAPLKEIRESVPELKMELYGKPGKGHSRIVEPVTFEELSNEYDPFKDGITQSLLSTFALCPEKFRLGYVERWTPVKTGRALDFGTVCHAALAHIYENFPEDLRLGISGEAAGMETQELVNDKLSKFLAASYTADRKRLVDFPSGNPNEFDELEETYGMAQVTLEGYFDNWLDDLVKMDWLGLEQEVSMPFKLMDGRTVMIKGKLDGVFRSGKVLRLMENKFRGRVDMDNTNNKLVFDLQVQTYLPLASYYYKEPVNGALYNITRRSQLRKKVNERRVDFLNRIKEDIATRPDFYFMRTQATFTEDERRRWQYEFQRRVEQFIHAWDNRNFYRDDQACDRWNTVCPFMPICSGNPVKGLYTRGKTFSELEVV